MPKMLIDAKLFGHIHNDAYLSGTENLQGNRLEDTTQYLSQYLESQTDLETNQDLSNFRKKIDYLSKISKQIFTINNSVLFSMRENQMVNKKLLADKTENLIKNLAKEIAQSVLNLAEQNSILLPGGWSGKPGHAMIYEFKKESR